MDKSIKNKQTKVFKIYLDSSIQSSTERTDHLFIQKPRRIVSLIIVEMI